jgi:hypothetical protein
VLWVAKAARWWQKRQGARHDFDRSRHDPAPPGSDCGRWRGEEGLDSPGYAVVQARAAQGDAELIELIYHM